MIKLKRYYELIGAATLIVKFLLIAQTNGETVPLSSPSGYRLNWTDAFTAALYWDEIDSANQAILGYKVSLCNVLKGSCTWSKLINLTTTDERPEIVVKDLKPNNLYKTRFAAFNSAGTGPWSGISWEDTSIGVFLFSTEKAPPHIAPTDVKASVKDDIVEVKWKNPEFYVTRVIGYRVEVWRENDTASDTIIGYNTDMSSQELSFRLTYGSYNLWVRGINYGGKGKPSAILSISTEMGKKATYPGGRSSVTRSSLLVLASSLLLWLLIDCLGEV